MPVDRRVTSDANPSLPTTSLLASPADRTNTLAWTTQEGVKRKWFTVDGIFGPDGVGFWVFLLILALLGIGFADPDPDGRRRFFGEEFFERPEERRRRRRRRERRRERRF